MKYGVKRFLRVLLVLTLCFSMAVPAYSKTKSEVESDIESLKEKKSSLESELSELKQNKSDTETYIAELDEKIQEYLDEISAVQAEISDTEDEIAQTQEDLEEARENEEIQYTALKARIKAIYESGEYNYMNVLFGSGDLKSMLNDQEYISKINEYDNILLLNLQSVREEIAEYEQKLEEEREVLESQEEQYELEEEALEEIVAQKEAELKSISADISSVYSDISMTEEELEAENDLLNEILEEERRAAEEEAARKKAEEEARKKAEEEAAKKAASSSSSSSGSSSSGSGSSSSGSTASSGKFIWPCDNTYISSYFGYRTSPTAGASSYHQGIDIPGSVGSPVYASASGTVTSASYDSSRGNYIIISHGNGISTVYMHCSALYVSVGSTVQQGQTIAAVGSTGVSTGAHLHFGVIVNGSYVNPLNYVSP